MLTDSHQQNARFSRAEANEMWSKLLWSDIANIKERHQMNIERWKSNSYFISQRRILVEDVRNLMIEYFLLDKRTVDDWYVYSKKKEDTKKRENDDEYHGLVIDKPTYTVKRRNPEQQHNNNPEDGNMYDYDPGLTKYSIDVYPLENSNIPGPLGVYKIVNGTIVISSELEKWLLDRSRYNQLEYFYVSHMQVFNQKLLDLQSRFGLQSLHLTQTTIYQWPALFKRFFDIILSSFLLILFTPIWLIVPFLIKLDSSILNSF